MVQMPQTVKIGPHVYSIVRKSKSELSDHGECDYNTLQISIRKRLRLSKTQEVLLHELLHGCGYPNLTAGTFEEEKFVDGISPNLLQVLKDNPDLLAYLTQ